ncbi:MAG: hypothetical protein WC222_07640 [Parachlamydiales bacterium]|jgi:hypothetical protein
MHIEIAQRLQAHSHQKGARFYLPWADCEVIVYPAFLEVPSLGKIDLPFKGPIAQITTALDLERGKLEIFGSAQNGYQHVPVHYDSNTSKLFTEQGSIEVPSKKDKFIPKEKISFGSHKAQNWNKMLLRNDPAEWLPHWHRMAQWAGDITQTIESEDSRLWDQYELCFQDYFVHETDLWKKMAVEAPSFLAPSPLIQGAAHLRSMLFRERKGQLFLLNHLPEGLVCGRYINAVFSWGTVDMEWSKGLVRRIIIRAEKNQEIELNFPKAIKHYRLCNSFTKNVLTNENYKPITLTAQTEYYLDRFEK